MKPIPFDGIESLVPAEHQNLVFRFFLVFSRFEYALKRARFIIVSGREIKPAWDKFSSKYNPTQKPSQIPKLQEAWNYFSTHPPRKQIINAGLLDWSDPQIRTTQPELTWLLDVVRIIRNNLFHGGKFPFEVVEDPTRNSTLLHHALVVIDVCTTFDDEVNSYIRSAD